MSEIQFVKGLYAKAKHPNSPTFIVCKLSAKRQELIDWLETRGDEWVNMEVKIAKDGQKLYVCVEDESWKKKKNEYEPPRNSEQDYDARGTVEVENDDGSVDIVYPVDDINPNDIPF